MTMYGSALATCLRTDVSVIYTRLMAELGKYAALGANLLIEHKWLEQAPSAPNRRSIVLQH